jgi:phosphoglycerate dehydrogenase-like enzyme
MDVWIPSGTRPEHRALLPAGITVHALVERGPLPEQLGHCDFLVAGFMHERALEAIPRFEGLRVVQSLSAGVEHLAGHMPAGVTLCDGSGVHDVSVAEWVVMAILAVRRRLPFHLDAQREATWRTGPHPAGGDDLEGSTVLIVGHGSIGRAVEYRLAPFGAHVVRVARHARDGVHSIYGLPELLPRADVAAMREGALLVNASRGEVVESLALFEALARQRICAALDVTDPEPLPDDHPLWTAPGVLITPHVAGSVRRYPDRAWQFCAEQIERFLRDEPLLNVVVDGY